MIRRIYTAQGNENFQLSCIFNIWQSKEGQKDVLPFALQIFRKRFDMYNYIANISGRNPTCPSPLNSNMYAFKGALEIYVLMIG